MTMVTGRSNCESCLRPIAHVYGVGWVHTPPTDCLTATVSTVHRIEPGQVLELHCSAMTMTGGALHHNGPCAVHGEAPDATR